MSEYDFIDRNLQNLLKLDTQKLRFYVDIDELQYRIGLMEIFNEKNYSTYFKQFERIIDADNNFSAEDKQYINSTHLKNNNFNSNSVDNEEITNELITTIDKGKPTLKAYVKEISNIVLSQNLEAKKLHSSISEFEEEFNSSKKVKEAINSLKKGTNFTNLDRAMQNIIDDNNLSIQYDKEPLYHIIKDYKEIYTEIVKENSLNQNELKKVNNKKADFDIVINFIEDRIENKNSSEAIKNLNILKAEIKKSQDILDLKIGKKNSNIIISALEETHPNSNQTSADKLVTILKSISEVLTDKSNVKHNTKMPEPLTKENLSKWSEKINNSKQLKEKESKILA